jgi:hypothetical protein
MAAVRLKYRTFSILEVEREKVRQLCDTERTESNHEALKETMGIRPMFLVNVQ